MNELDVRVADLEASSQKTEGRMISLERDVGVLKMHCAGRADLAEAKAEILVKLAESENTLKTEIVTAEHRLRAEINASENKLRTEIIGAESRLAIGINSVRDGLRTEIAQAKNWLLFWVLSSIFIAQYLPAMLRKLGLG
ncbi:MAG: hypothetical protein ACXWC4_19510 [Telluria sp.]